MMHCRTMKTAPLKVHLQKVVLQRLSLQVRSFALAASFYAAGSFIACAGLFVSAVLFFAVSFFAVVPAFAAPRRAVPTIKNVSVLNASTREAVENFNPLVSGSTLLVTSALSKGIMLRANTSAHPSNLVVRFKLTNQNGKVKSGRATKYPYIFRNKAGAAKLNLATGGYSLTVTPFLKRNSASRQGRQMALSFSVGQPASGNNPVNPATPTPVTPSPSDDFVVDRSLPGLSTWEANMKSYGRRHCENLKSNSISADAHLADVYYDAEWVFYQIGDYTGDSYWYNCSQLAEKVYRDDYVIRYGGKIPGYWNFTHGLAEDYLRTGDAKSKDAVHSLATTAAFAPDSTPLSSTVSADLSREVAYAIMAYLNDERVGNAHRSRTESLVGQALGHTNQWFITKDAPYVRPFMFALTAHALISYQTQIGGNSQILPALKTGADWLWDNTWNASRRAFQYTDRNVDSGGTELAPDLNLLVAPVYAWLWNQTGETRFRDRADQIFAGGVDGAFLSNAKQFNQNYRLSFQYIRLRSIAPSK